MSLKLESLEFVSPAMVCTAEGSKERNSSERAATFKVMGPDRSRPLHNFSLPGWGSHRQLRCMKIAPPGFRSPSPSPGLKPSSPRTVSAEKRRRSEDAVVPKLRIGEGIDCDREIKAVKEKFLIDLRAEMDRIRDKYLGQGAESGEAAEQGKQENPVRPWNLRTRRAACRAPIDGAGGGKATASHSPQKGEGENNNLSSLLKPALRSGTEKREERAKFCPTLNQKEVEDDFMKITGRRPPRKPKKRPRAVQRQLEVSGIPRLLNLISSN